ncbi:MAG: ATP-binding cassette domain-containing protein [Actinomycetota bacterium]|nr:ATP-binding cassette domain-containing protein [Actinomycetota bacterium]
MEAEREQMSQDEKETPILEVRNVTKRFGATLALDNISLELRRGEVLALLGDNGAGKSTLIKCLSGVHQPDEGQVFLEGEEVRINSPMEARDLGMETVYQDLSLFDNMNVVGNFYAGREPVTPRWLGGWGWVRDGFMSSRAKESLESLQVNLPSAEVEIGLMSGGQRQAVASARAMSFGRKIVILDEPTSALGARESSNVLRLIKEAPEHGVSVIVISHNLEHVIQVCHRAVVLRQGVRVGEAEPTEENHEHLVSMIVGGAAEQDKGEKQA